MFLQRVSKEEFLLLVLEEINEISLKIQHRVWL